MSVYYHPLWPDSSEATARSTERRVGQRERRGHGPWHNAGATNPDGTTEPVCNLTPDSNYINGVGVRWRRRLGGGTEIQIAVTDGADGNIVLTLEAGWYLPGEDRIPLTGHNASGAQAFYIDSGTGDIVVGV